VLEAMGTIDDMVESNRLNVQLLASIPAFLLVTFGTRIFFAAMFSFRSRDLVGLPTAHAEMSDILRNMERCLLLASHESDLQTVTGDRKNNGVEFMSPQTVTLRPKELGEFVLHMHSYLVLLDYCSPPFPSKTCDAIQKGMQDLLLQGQLTTKRQNSLLQVILSF
jgi:nuclear-control-of-ATPase protein 2